MAEASLPGERGDGVPHHMTAVEAAEVARGAEADLLILTHLRPSLDSQQAAEDAKRVFSGEVAIASNGDVYEI